MSKGHLSDERAANRLQTHGKISAQQMTNGFNLGPGNPFSICVIPKNMSGVLSTPLIVDLKLYHDNESSGFPVNLNDWTPGSIIELAPGAIDVSVYDVYWAS